MNNLSKNWKSALFYILIPVLLVVLRLPLQTSRTIQN